MKKIAAALIALYFALSAPVSFGADVPKQETAQQPQVTASTPPQPAAPKPAQAQPNSAQNKFAGPPVTFFFDDADVYEVAQTVFGEILKVNYMIDPKVKGRVNFRTIAPVPRSEVLPLMETVFRLNGIGIVHDGAMYRLVTLDDVARELVYSQIGKQPENITMELFTFKNINIRDFTKDIETALGVSLSGSMAKALPLYRLNAVLAVAPNKEQIDYVGRWVSAFDRMFEGARPRVYVYPVQSSKAKDVASLLQQIYLGAASSSSTSSVSSTSQTSKPASTTTPASSASTAPAAAQPKPAQTSSTASQGGVQLVSDITRIFADEVTNTVVILATPEDYNTISDTIKQIDIVPRQVVIEALIAEVTLGDELRFGLEWSLKTDVKKHIKPFSRDIDLKGNIGFDSANLDPTKLTGFTFLGTDAAGVVRAMLQTLAGESKLKVLASPHVIASDNREARIQIGDQVPIVTSETNVTGTTNIQRTIQYKDTGTILKVRPQINESGLVSLEITQEVSDYALKLIYGAEYPIIYKREASTTLVVKDGETIVIGGLIRDKVDRTQEGLPLLSKIPILGHLFGYTSNTESRTELIVLLTPRVIRNQQEAQAVTADYLNRLKGIKKEFKDEEMVIKKKNADKQDSEDNKEKE
jgi:general secretion pathway protein D